MHNVHTNIYTHLNNERIRPVYGTFFVCNTQ